MTLGGSLGSMIWWHTVHRTNDPFFHPADLSIVKQVISVQQCQSQHYNIGPSESEELHREMLPTQKLKFELPPAAG